MNPSLTVPRIWPGETAVVMGTGPSLSQADVDYCRDKARVIAVNDAYRYAPWADVLYGADPKWWKWHEGAPTFQGMKVGLARKVPMWPGLPVVQSAGRRGLSLDPTRICTGHDSSYQAINLAVLFGAARILLLGIDMQVVAKRDHCFGEHRDRTKPAFPLCLAAYPSLVAPLAQAGVDVVNCTLGSALRCFPMAALRDTLLERAA